MDKFIVITTINKPTEALIKYSEIKGWILIVVGDLKTPHHLFKDINCIYMHPEEQEKKYPILSKAIGWNQSPRRNIGFVEAYTRGADILALCDDDNIPYDDWGQELFVNQEIEVDCYDTPNEIFDPLSITNCNHLWHRGYPIELVPTKNDVKYVGKVKRKVMVQANLWDGDPDIDAVERLIWHPVVKFNITKPYCSTKKSPFDSQNTFLAREAIPYFMLIPFTERVDDIWGSYLFQQKFSDSIIYHKSTVYQNRNVHNLIQDMGLEIYGYNYGLEFSCGNVNVLKDEAKNAIEAYRGEFK